jgi:hypothetical protein
VKEQTMPEQTLSPEDASRQAHDLERQQLRSAAIQKKQDLRARVLRGEITEQQATDEAMGRTG